jgi:hypothetical protein
METVKPQGGNWPFVIVASTAMLLWPAFYNRFPLVFPDTGAYLSVAWGPHWTLDRSGFYGLIFRLFSGFDPHTQLWAGLVAQVAFVAAVVCLSARRLIPNLSSFLQLAIILSMAIATSLPWHAAQLMPDVFAGVTVLLLWLASTRNPTESGVPLLWLCAFAAALMHYTYVPLFAAAAGGSLAAQLMLRSATISEIIKRALIGSAVLAAVLATHTVANGVALNRWTPAPLGSMFVFARLNEEGIVQPWLEENCPKGTTPDLCRAEPLLPRDSQQLLWANSSPMLRLVTDAGGTNTNQEFIRQLQTANLGSIEARPIAFARRVLQAGAVQFFRFNALDDECPEVCGAHSSAVYGWIHDARPSLLPAFLSSKQLQGTISKSLARAITWPVALLSLTLIPLLAMFAWKRRDDLACTLIAATSASLVVNALITGGLSDVHDRYQSRIVWLAPFMLIALAVRWRRQSAAFRANDSQAEFAGAR